MILISHRGNLNGKNEARENTESYIEEALSSGFNVEVDVWRINNKWFLGHDGPITETCEDFVYRPRLWVHCKNVEAMSVLVDGIRFGFPNFFFHDTDAYTITSVGYIWAYPGKPLCNRCICVMPERAKYTEEELTKCDGICSDVIEKYR